MTTTAAHPPTTARVPTPRPKPGHARTSSLHAESATATAPSKSRPNQSSPSTGSGQPPTPTTTLTPPPPQHDRQQDQQQPGGPRRGARTASAAAPLSDKATAFLVRRILCPQQPDKGRSSPAPIEHLLPPLTSRNDVDLQLYALIAIILREFVQNWYAKITPDETFVAEIVQIIAHITRALEQRVRKVDLESLLFDELPELLDRHITAYRAAHDPITQPPVSADPREIYHSLCPLPALSPVPRPEDPESVAAQAQNEAAYRQLLVYAFMAILLPTEDLENSCLTALVGQIFSELILGNAVANRLSEPWLIWELLIISARTAGRQKAAEDEVRLAKQSNGSPGSRNVSSVQALFWTILQWCFLAVSFIRTAFAILLTSRSLPPRSSHHSAAFSSGATRHETSGQSKGLARPSHADPNPAPTPVLTFRAWSAAANLVEMDVRMPWLSGALSMLQWIAVMGPGRIAGPDGKLDRLLSYGIHRHVLDAANLPPLLRAVRGALFPGNMPAGKSTLVAPSSDAELHALRRRCASALWALVPNGVGRLFFGGGLLRASPVSRACQDRTEGSAELKSKMATSNDKGRGEGEGQGGPDDSDKGRGLSSSASSRREEEKASRLVETATAAASSWAQQARGQERSGAAPARSPRSAPAPRPKTGGQGPCLTLPPSASVSASPRGADVDSLGASGGGLVASTRLTHVDEKGHRDHDRGGDGDDPDDRDGGAVDDEDKGGDPDEEILREIERGVLDVFGDAYCNKHLVYGILELVLVRLLPELGEKGVLELWSERIPVGV